MKCGECGREVSSKAAKCPHCGNPITASKEVKATGGQLATTQLTAKRFKGQMLLAAVLCGIAAGMLFGGESAESKMYGTLLFIGGFAWFLVTRIRAWWHHG